MFKTEEELIQHMTDIASAHGLEYEVAQTYKEFINIYEQYDELSMDDKVRCMFDALYEWDI